MDIATLDIPVNSGSYTNLGMEVPLGVECAMPYLVQTTSPPVRARAECRYPTLVLVHGHRQPARSEEPGPVHPRIP